MKIGPFARVGHFTIGQFAGFPGFKVSSLLGFFTRGQLGCPQSRHSIEEFARLHKKALLSHYRKLGLNVFAKFFNNLVKRCYGGEEASGILYWSFCNWCQTLQAVLGNRKYCGQLTVDSREQKEMSGC